MRKFHQIEANNGLLVLDVPVDLQSFRGQARIRDYAWRVTEELAEALHAETLGDRLEELADGLHFMTEMLLNAGVFSADMVSLEDMMGLTRLPHDFDQSVSGFIQNLGMTMNLLTNRPWKQTPRPLIEPMFHTQLIQLFTHYCQLCETAGHVPSSLWEDYVLKAAENHKRIEDGV